MNTEPPKPRLTPISNRLVPQFRYQRTPSGVMPLPSLPERIILPMAGIHDLFEVRLAADDAVEADAFSVRWQVYCRELGYEPAERFPDQCEHDSADQRSVQVVAYHRPTGRPAACFRLLLADPVRPGDPFHVEQVCRELVAGAIPTRGEIRRGCAELSRFCIISSFRRFDVGNDTPPWGIPPARWAAESGLRRGLAGLLWLAAAYLAAEIRLDYLLVLMEPRLEILGRTMGLSFQAIGPAVEFRGLRMPYRISRRNMRALLALPQTAGLLAPLAANLERGLEQHPLLRPYLQARTQRILPGFGP